MAVRYLNGDCLDVLKQLKDESFYTCITSPPYWGLRDYGVDGQLGLEETPEEYIEKLVAIFREVRRTLRDDGTLWLNLGDSYCRSPKAQIAQGGVCATKSGYQYDFSHKKNYGEIYKEKDLVGIPWMAAFALRKDGWYLRSDIIWHKGSCMPESVKDRPTKSHEYIFLLSKSKKYYYDIDAIREECESNDNSNEDKKRGYSTKDNVLNVDDVEQHHGKNINYSADGKRNKRTVWTVNPRPFKEAHFAVYPPELITPCVKAGCPDGGWVLDPFGGSGTTAEVANNLNKNCILIDINKEYTDMQWSRSNQMTLEEGLVGDKYEKEADEITKDFKKCP